MALRIRKNFSHPNHPALPIANFPLVDPESPLKSSADGSITNGTSADFLAGLAK